MVRRARVAGNGFAHKDGLGDRIPGPGGEQYPTSPLGERTKGIPTGRDVEWEPLVDYRRFGVSETTIHGAIAWAHGRKVIHSFGGNVLCYGRSMMKPLVMKVFAEELANCTWEQKAIAVSSHNGDTEHVAAAQSLLHETEWGLMQAPLELPLVPFGRTVRRPRRWYHPCSGEHAAILAGCKAKGWPRIGYLLPQHPWFQAYTDEVRSVLGKDWEPIRTARDGCGTPTLSNTVSELAVLYAELARTKDDDWIWEAFIRNPDLVGGFNRLDTTILKSCDGKVVAKEGADGLLGLSIVHPDYPDGLGVVVKIAHGWNPRATWYIARAILGVLGFRLRNPYPLSRQKAFIVPGVVPPRHAKDLEAIATWDEWDPDMDRWYYDWEAYVGSQSPMRGFDDALAGGEPGRDGLHGGRA
ncbi:MAG: asparaginase [Candidatus Thermoplasmatota archaeon]